MLLSRVTRRLATLVGAIVIISQTSGAQGTGVYYNKSSGATIADANYNLKVMVCAPAQLIYFNVQQFYSGGSGAPSVAGGSSWMSCDSGLQAQPYDISATLEPGLNTIWIDAGDGLNFEESIGFEVTLSESQGAVVDVTTAGGHAQMTTGAIAKRRFHVESARSGQRVFVLGVSCSGAVTCTGMSQPSSVWVSQNEKVDVLVSYSVSGAAGSTGTLTLTATESNDNSNTDNVAASVQVIPAPPIASRSACLRLPLGPGAELECGTLRVSHGLPGVRTYNEMRAPVLTYESQQASPRPIVSIPATLPVGQPTPDYVVTTLVVNGDSASHTVPGAQFLPAGTAKHASVAIDLRHLATGLYSYSIEVRRFWNGTSAVLASATGSIPLVNRNASPFGAGWWIAGVEQIHGVSSTRKLWVGGDGSARVYEKIATVGSDTVFLAARHSYSDTLRFVASSGTWQRRLPNGGYVGFDSQLRHVTTNNRLGRTTSIEYENSRVSKITVPPSGAALSYVFAYTNGKLDSVTVPDSTLGAKRVTRIAIDAKNRLTSIADPGIAGTLAFGYGIGGDTLLLVSRSDRRGGLVSVAYDSTRRVRQSQVKLNATETATTSFCVGESMGLTACQSALVAVGEVRTVIDGARTDSADVTTIWLDGLGAPTRIQNANNANTYIARTDARFPALVTRLQLPDNHVTSALYDDRGNLVVAVDSSLNVGGVRATTRYEWHSVWNLPTQILSPTLTYVKMDYDATYGTLSWQEDRRGASSRTKYEYDANQLLRAVRLPPDTVHRDSVYYDPKRYNVSKTKSAAGRTTEYVTDSVGRVIVSKTAIGVGLTQDVSVGYDQLNRVIRQVSLGPSVGGESAKSISVTNSYDEESNLLSVTREMNPVTGGISALNVSWVYDLAGRKTVEVASDGARDSTRYDLASNPITNVTRRGGVISMSYDRLNRLSRRTASVPTNNDTLTVGAADTNKGLTFWSLYGGYSYSTDSATFAYDAADRLTVATNQDARVKRTYTPFGALETDSLFIKSWSRATETKYGTRYVYDIAGRTTALVYPSHLVDTSITTGKAAYSYDATTGYLSEVRGLQNELFAFTYNARSELTGVAMPGNIHEFNGYDNDGLLIRHGIRNPTTSGSDRFPYALIDSTDIFRNLRGGVDSAYNRAGPLDKRWAYYDGLGQVRADSMKATGKDMRDLTINATVREVLKHDAMGNIHEASELFTHSQRTSSSVTNSYSATGTLSEYLAATARLKYRVKTDSSERQSFFYDLAGNNWLTTLAKFDAQNIVSVYDDRASYFNTLGQLVGAERRTATRSDGDLFRWRQLIETYRYDPLGRRVMVRGEVLCPPYIDNGYGPDCFTKHTRRTVWAGDRELMEIQRPDSTWAWPFAQALSDTSDTAPIIFARRESSGAFPGTYDINPQYGRVAYVYGPALDRPLSISRFAYHDKPVIYGTEAGYSWPIITFVPHWNSRGEASTGTFIDGDSRYRVTPHSSHVHEFAVDWELGGLAYGRLKPNGFQPAWNGTLITQKRDLTGTLYRRNRYYDPGTGRFTQEDPIGLAGGVNLYGYANGDPINLGDPFGLCASGGDYTYDQCGNQIGYTETGGADRHFMQLESGQTVQIDGRPIAGTTPYRIISSAAALDRVARAIADNEDDNYGLEDLKRVSQPGADLDFKPDVYKAFGVRTLWNAGDVGGVSMYVHGDKVGNAAWARYVRRNTAAWLELALWGARGQADAAGAVGENLDQLFIRRGWGLP